MNDDRLVLHGSFTSSSSYKPMLFLALSGLPFSFRTVNLKNGVQKQPAHLAINRYGQVPVLQHRGLTLMMSNVILDYLARTTGKFEAESEQDRIHAREWLSWENDAITNVARVRHFARFRPDVDPMIVNFFRPRPRRRSTSSTAIWPAGNGSWATAAPSPISAAWAAWCSWPKAACRSTTARTPRLARPADGDAGLRAALRPHSQEGRRVRVEPTSVARSVPAARVWSFDEVLRLRLRTT